MDAEIERIWGHVEFLASEPRFAGSDRLEECRQYCERELWASRWPIERREFNAVSAAGLDRWGINLVATRSTSSSSPRPKFVLGAHVDSCEETPGADDNASAVAALLEVARLVDLNFSDEELQNAPVELEVVVFDLEEHGMLGGAFHAASCRQNDEDLCGMVSLEMLGYCSHEPGSQTLPPEIAGMYPDVANFIASVGNQISGDLLKHFDTAFDSVANLPHEALQLPDNGTPLPPSRLSDHSPFWDEGFPALMVTDTSFMRNPHYHQPTDTPETLDREFLHKVTEGVWKAVESLLKTGLAS